MQQGRFEYGSEPSAGAISESLLNGRSSVAIDGRATLNEAVSTNVPAFLVD
jgi:hypothetical protein